MRIIDRVLINIADVRSFGFSFLLRHLPRLTGAQTALVRLPNDQLVHLRPGESDVAVVRQTFRDAQYRIGFNPPSTERVSNRYRDIVGRGKTPIIIDAGANIGAASLWFTRAYPEAQIVAIEPDPDNYAVLEKNVALTHSIDPVHAAIGSKPGFVRVKRNGKGWVTQTERSDDGIPIITMAEAFSRHAEGVPFIAKIDIEGFEGDLFSTDTEWLSETCVVFIEPHDWLLPGKCTSRSFQAAMGRQNYEIYLAGEILTYVRR